ncbi:hypothetical protein B0H13DRAFT_2319353 [Mycena leptocephala]|nr:hypothetical protein B0H13DRAFT_2319353 [Mycena leptocephala]
MLGAHLRISLFTPRMPLACLFAHPPQFNVHWIRVLPVSCQRPRAHPPLVSVVRQPIFPSCYGTPAHTKASLRSLLAMLARFSIRARLLCAGGHVVRREYRHPAGPVFGLPPLCCSSSVPPRSSLKSSSRTQNARPTSLCVIDLWSRSPASAVGVDWRGQEIRRLALHRILLSRNTYYFRLLCLAFIILRLSERVPTFHHSMARQLPPVGGLRWLVVRTFTLAVHDRAAGWIDGLREACLAPVWTDAVAGGDVGEYSAPLHALVRPPVLLSITPPFPLPSLVSTVLTFRSKPTSSQRCAPVNGVIDRRAIGCDARDGAMRGSSFHSVPLSPPSSREPAYQHVGDFGCCALPYLSRC